MPTEAAALRKMACLLGASGIKQYDVDPLTILKETNLARNCISELHRAESLSREFTNVRECEASVLELGVMEDEL